MLYCNFTSSLNISCRAGNNDNAKRNLKNQWNERQAALVIALKTIWVVFFVDWTIFSDNINSKGVIILDIFGLFLSILNYFSSWNILHQRPESRFIDQQYTVTYIVLCISLYITFLYSVTQIWLAIKNQKMKCDKMGNGCRISYDGNNHRNKKKENDVIIDSII